MRFSKNIRLVAMVLFAIVMFSAIQFELNLYLFIGLFVVAPVLIYFFVKKIFPQQ